MDTTMIGLTNGSSPTSTVTPGRGREIPAALISGFDPTQAGFKVMDRIFAAASSKAVFGEPITAGAYTIITAGEVRAGGGFGFGRGFGPAALAGPATHGAPGAGAPQRPAPTMIGGGGGLGGGGASTGRPIALIVIGPAGVKVQPFVDVTQIVLTSLTTMAKLMPLLLKQIKAVKRAK